MPAGWRHGVVASRLCLWLAQHIEQHDSGMVLGARTGFLLSREPDTVLAPDVAFIGKDRLPTALPEEGFWPGAPDLAIEVVSANDTVNEVDARVRGWLDAGTILVWVVDPKCRSVTIHRSAAAIRTLTETDEICGEDALAGFCRRVADLFAIV